MPIDVEEATDGHALVSFCCIVTIMFLNVDFYQISKCDCHCDSLGN